MHENAYTYQHDFDALYIFLFIPFGGNLSFVNPNNWVKFDLNKRVCDGKIIQHRGSV